MVRAPVGAFDRSASGLGIIRRFVKPAAATVDEDEADVWGLEDSSRVLNTELESLLSRRKRQHVVSARTFLPRILQQSLAGKNNAVVMHRCTGCVVFSDASGFTKLTETLAKRHDGAEVLSKCLNKFFTPLIDIIEAYRGDVIKFSGDALSILFEATDDYTLHPGPCGSPDTPKKTPQQLACLRASACCIEIHKRLHNFDTGEGSVRLTLHIGVGAGNITILQVGGEQGRFEYVIAGTPMEQISIAEPLAGSGETVLSPQTWAEVSYTVVEGEPLLEGPPGYHRLAGLDSSLHTYPTVKHAALECSREEALQKRALEDTELLQLSERFIPRSVLKHLRSGNSSSINEMRSVTIIFAQIGGVDVSTDEGAKIAQSLMKGMQRACYTYEGNLNKFLVDDKGVVFLFVFGLPPLMHIDDPTRAIASCFEMVDVLKAMNLCGRFGVTTGRVYCGIVGSDQRREYTVMGDTANLSARLMAKAEENSVLIDEFTYNRAKHEVICRKLDPIMVKGKANLIPVYAPTPPQVHSLKIWQLSSLLTQYSWNLQATELDVQVWTGTSIPQRMPWRASSQLLGGTSPGLHLKRWRELQQVEQMLSGPLGLLKVGGSLALLGESGSGKQEIAEYLVSKSISAKLVPLFGVMTARPTQQWRAVAELLQSCLCVLCHKSVDKATGKPSDEAVERVLQRIAQKDKRRHQVLSFLGFEGFEVPGERELEGGSLTELEEGAADIAAALVREVADQQGVTVVLRFRRGTDIFNGLSGKGTTFWRLSNRLFQVAQDRQKEIEGGAHVHPILVVTMARCGPEPNTPEGLVEGPSATLSSRTALGGRAYRCLHMQHLTEDAAVELMCHCLGLQTSDGGFQVKRKLREFTLAVSISNPAYIRECITHLISEKCVEVTKAGECSITVQDLNAVNIAEWVQTSMVGGTISTLESLGSASNHIMKLATVFDGPFTPLDLAAANRILFGKIPRILAFYDQAKLLCACQALVRQNLLKAVPADGRSGGISLPRWTISNSLFRKVAGSMVLNSQRILIKRAVLIDRALNIEIPKRIRPGQKASGRAKSNLAPSRQETGISGTSAAGSQIGSIPPGSTDARPSLKSDCSPFEPMQPSEAGDDQTEVMNLLISACCLANVVVATEVLTVRGGVDVNKASEGSGYTPLHYACSGGNVEIVQLLLDRGALADMKSAKGEIPLLVAAQRGHLEVVQCLCESHGALAQNGLDKIEFWERALPEITLEDDIPKPLSPSFQVQPVDPEDLKKRRQEVTEWLTSQLSQRDVGNSDWAELGDTPRAEVKADKKELSVTTPEVERPSRDSVESNPSFDKIPSRWSNDSGKPQKSILPSNKAVSAPTLSRIRQTGLPSIKNISSGIFPATFRNAAWRVRVRSCLRSRLCVAVMMLALAIALYLPDIWVSAGVPNNVGIDVVLSLVMFLFLTELILLSLVDASYPLSFFFFMDCIGTLTMISDISYLGLGVDATQVQKNQSNERDLTLFRATRTAKIGARAGRLSRLVKIMRFLPGIGVSRGKAANEAEKLQQISNQLTNVLSKRVACLTILLVIVMPLFTIGLYPEGDFSMEVWVQALARRAQDTHPDAAQQFQSALEQFTTFYDTKDYGPYRVCVDGNAGVPQGCTDLRASKFSAPERRHFQLEVVTIPVSAFFDFGVPTRAEANMGITLISLVIVLMCGACLLLNYSASELAVRPLERMLTSIKRSAKAIFSSVAALEPEGDEEDFGEDMDGEVALLERVVRKIATLAELSSKKNPFDEATMTGMKSEELGVLALTAVHNVRAASITSGEATGGDEPEAGRNEVTVTMQWQLEEIGLAYEVVNSWDFNVLELPELKQEQISAWLLMNNPGSCHYTEHNVDIQKLRAFINLVAKGYLANPYHNFMHAVDVTHTVFRYMTLMQADKILMMLDQFALLVASISHDIGHIGLNNGFLTEVQHELAIRYNDRSPLENLHCCKLFEILAQPVVNVFSSVSSEQYRDVRKNIIEVILHTDICQHPAMVKELELLYEMNSKVFEANVPGQLSEQEIEVLSSAESKKLVLKVILHAADTANPTKPWHIAHDWAYRVLEEYANQGEQEKKLGIPVQMLNDREKVNRPNSQIGFIEFIITPLVAAEVKIFPSWYEASILLEQNLHSWEQLWIQESNPSEAERHKVAERAQKIAAMLSASVKGVAPGSRPGGKRRMSFTG